MTNMLRIPGTLPPGFTAYADAPPTQTPEEIAVGQSTLLANWFDPATTYLPADVNGKRSWAERLNGSLMKNRTDVGTTAPTLTTAINSKPTVSMAATTALTSASVNVNAGAWSIACVGKGADSTTRFLTGQNPTTSVAGNYGPSIAIYLGQTIRIYDEANASRLDATNVLTATAAFTIVVGFSTSRGITIRLNGTQVAQASGATQALTRTQLQIGQNKNTAGSAWSGALGDFLIYNADITEPLPGSGATDAQKAQAAALASCEAYLRAKYATW